MKKRPIHELSRRERQVLERVYRLGQATASEITALLPDSASYSAVRGMLRVLEEKGHLRHRYDGPRYVYFPTVPHGKAMQSALKNVLSTFFDDSPEGAVAALLEMESANLTPEQLEKWLTIKQRFCTSRPQRGDRDRGDRDPDGEN